MLNKQQTASWDAAARSQPVITHHVPGPCSLNQGCSLPCTLDVSQGSSAEVTINLDLLHVSSLIKTVTAIDFSIKRVSASRNGHYLLLVGQQGEVRGTGCAHSRLHALARMHALLSGCRGT